jgi:hypothetical protein
VLKGRKQTIFRQPTGASGEEGDMSFAVEGDYFEVCNCDVSCNCVWLGPATQAQAKDVNYHGHWTADFSGANSFVTDFRYEG